MRVKEKFKKKLLVEGNNDQHVVWALCNKFNLRQTFDVIDCEGVDNLTEQIPLRFKQSAIETLGIIIDADTTINNRWISIKGILTTQGFNVPNAIPSTGLVLKAGSLKVGVWIMPNNKLDGTLEDFISFLVPKDDKLLPIVHSTLDDIEKKQLNKYAPAQRSKAVIHSWLSWQEDPGTPLGLSITKKYLTTDEATCSRLMKWMDELFDK
jgi:hypothetical protein